MTDSTAPADLADDARARFAEQRRALPFLRRHGALILLMLTFMVAFVDRQLLAILQESVKRDLNLTDSQLGLLSGTAFALFYITFGVPIGRLADVWVRRDLIAISLAAWSAMTSLTGLAQSFLHIVLARIGVAVGEAGCNPAGYSMIADLYPPHQRATATAFFNTGASWGMLLGFLLGGWLEAVVGWRGAFIIVGLPGVALALILRFSIKEPPRAAAKQQNTVSFAQGLRFISTKQSLIALGLGVSFSGTAGYVPILWGASYFIRVHELTPAEIGTWLALTLGLCGAIASLTAAFFADKLALRDLRWRVRIPALINLVSAPLWALGFIAPTGAAAMAWLFVPLALCNAFSGIAYALINSLTPPTFRATASAIFLLLANGVGMGIGVLGVGALSDALLPTYGVHSIQYAILIVVPAAALLAAASYFWAASSLRADQAAAEATQ
jgi:predicted MFS family arabinose efflux permease